MLGYIDLIRITEQEGKELLDGLKTQMSRLKMYFDRTSKDFGRKVVEVDKYFDEQAGDHGNVKLQKEIKTKCKEIWRAAKNIKKTLRDTERINP